MFKLISGKAIAQKRQENLRLEVENLNANGVTPSLRVVLVGNSGPSEIYVRNKARRAKELGLDFNLIRFDETVSEKELIEFIDSLNHDKTVDAILVQLPLPQHINEEKVVQTVSPNKDVDGFSPINFGYLWQNNPNIIPSTAGGIMTLLEESDITTTAKHVVIVGRSNIVGRPLGALMLNSDATVTMAHSKTKDLKSITKQADILISAVGKAHFITADMVKKGATVIDVGMNRDENDRLVGDVDFDDVSSVAGAMTPVPGGVGPMTILTLMEQTIEIAKKRV
ncbi:bifunctional 5,10-methylenetetrahydrofolate dehydrogenase/5,10-methenyltetrahydrofolate cyclohydrolase [Holzapfeliella floricola]|uniref:Bifunctional protein FolD n=1 Tax=Holzapfeliella floricola DSM 23037 = JCM 16512 TaxID=1423744 RepID=A0A0R2DUI2_9LACO|nr:tetrahydrofolate dehydrogenase/cyclohydrolase catalytic domain-containing protein [Holzapfeliella floricola]KRN03853.1 bifunctional 5,10-methylene-tetrahydrofolate dehydrogenase 5,10-methylene-tetrahydrofolate cyclohydrolase [Holzapfeliella floricola DSM 23037 = JCM 16512]